MKLTLGQVKTPVARVLNFTTTDSRIVEYVNRASERLVEGLYAKGTIFRYRVCASDGCVVLPRQLETVEAFAICCTPGTVRGNWFEFIGAGPGIQGEDSCSSDLILQDEVASFDQVKGTGKKLAIYTTVNEASGGYVILQFWDENGQWVRTQYSGQYIDGERLAIPTTAGTYAYTTNTCMADGFVAAIKSVTNSTIRLYEYNPTDGALKALAYYEHDEEVPRYRSALVPALKTVASEGDDCAKKTLTLQGKARFIPVRNDNDFLQIESVEAVRLACQAVKKEEENSIADADYYWRMAFSVLDRQLRHYQGSGAVQPIQIQDAAIAGPGVCNLV